MRKSGGVIDRRLLRLSSADNCLVVTRPLAAGETVEIEGRAVTLDQPIAVGHKVARKSVAAGEQILKYGAIIGHASAPIDSGRHIHTHNLESDYLQTFPLEAGKQFAGAAQ